MVRMIGTDMAMSINDATIGIESISVTKNGDNIHLSLTSKTGDKHTIHLRPSDARNLAFYIEQVATPIQIPEEIIKRAERLSNEWNSTCFVVHDSNGFGTALWNHYKEVLKDLNTIARVNSDGWKINPHYTKLV